MNKIILCGRLGKDPDVKDVNGVTLTKFSIATSKKFKDKQGNPQEQTTWHNIDTWAALADNCGKYLSKGRQVLVEGEIQNRQYEKEGVTCYATSVRASNVQFLGSASETAKDANASGPSELTKNEGFGPEPSFDAAEEIPF